MDAPDRKIVDLAERRRAARAADRARAAASRPPRIERVGRGVGWLLLAIAGLTRAGGLAGALLPLAGR